MQHSIHLERKERRCAKHASHNQCTLFRLHKLITCSSYEPNIGMQCDLKSSCNMHSTVKRTYPHYLFQQSSLAVGSAFVKAELFFLVFCTATELFATCFEGSPSAAQCKRLNEFTKLAKGTRPGTQLSDCQNWSLFTIWLSANGGPSVPIQCIKSVLEY